MDRVRTNEEVLHILGIVYTPVQLLGCAGIVDANLSPILPRETTVLRSIGYRKMDSHIKPSYVQCTSSTASTVLVDGGGGWTVQQQNRKLVRSI